jgi:hypothetical protein
MCLGDGRFVGFSEFRRQRKKACQLREDRDMKSTQNQGRTSECGDAVSTLIGPGWGVRQEKCAKDLKTVTQNEHRIMTGRLNGDALSSHWLGYETARMIGTRPAL